MHWHSEMDGPWTPEAAQKFRENGYDGLSVLAGREWTPQNLDFLLELPGLRSLDVTGKVREDRAAFRIASLEDLTLITGSELPIPDEPQPRLARLCLVDRPAPPHPVIDFAAFTSPALTRLWIMNAARLRNIGALKKLPFLRELTPAPLKAVSALPRRLHAEVV